MLRLLASVVLLSPLAAACGGVVEPQTGDHSPAPTSTSTSTPMPPAPSPSTTPAPAPHPTPSPSPTPTPSPSGLPSPSPPTPVQGSDVQCWSPGGVALTPTSPCSAVGTWDYAASEGGTGSLSFDVFGNWIGGAAGADLCAGHTMYGTYGFQGSDFEFLTIHDSSVCGGDWGRGYQATFDATCTHATFRETTDNCTGARTEFNGDLTLTKR